ncbi:hypothetical protein ASPZODRAFT_76667 [Penicilliopsis zonata CBS 506.65]|uniref:Uncharacterized protein n=1 Tax=Penicilliopsis zonata CBS 506.65 TaxID=1073090 RepID=A0A1L9S5V5_9EURO|nr:hypothetical protein ASPZODRAFT_76667 [Penicilliopsis zonata CBS 506.65]OJJ42520.1 hypothetical protein ASPZODRAFT_76667 [Penicilliopsis zonata CBS 506.65]
MSIAIVGMAFRGPGDARDVRGLYEMVAQGREAWSEIPAQRWNAKAFYHPDHSRYGQINVPGGHFMSEDVMAFDAPFFNLTADEAEAMDPQQRLLLEVTYQAFENAGIPLHRMAKTPTSCFVASFCGDYTDLLLRDPEAIPMYQCTNAGQSRAMVANRLSYFFDLRGPSVTVDTACSGSLVALHLACQSLRSGEATAAVAAGVNLILSHEFMSTMSMMKFLSPSGRCYTFDDRASGYARGEAIATLVLKPLELALRDGDPIRAIIRGSGSNQDGRTAGITLPSGEAQESLIRSVYDTARLDPRQTAFVEAHGTGTPAGDPIETGAIARVFCLGDSPREEPLRIGSVKTNVGHLEGASGLAGVIKAVLMLEQGVFLPGRNFETVNPKIDLEKWNLRVQTTVEPWTAPLRRVSVNSFGYGGSNAHVILENYPAPFCQCKDVLLEKPSPKLFILSGFDETACRGNAARLAEYLTDHPVDLDRLANTINHHRTLFPFRTAAVGSSAEELAATLSSSSSKPVRALSRPPVLGFVFTGQGAQWAGMGQALHGYRVFRESIDQIDRELALMGAEFTIKEILRGDHDVNTPLYSQAACTALQIALVDLLASWAITPAAVTGHSSGEIAAAYAARALGRRDAMAVAYHRGRCAARLTQDTTVQGGMMAVGLGVDAVEQYLAAYSGRVIVACVNSPVSVTVSGDSDAISQLDETLEKDNIFHRRLAVSVAYHSHHMRRVEDEYRASLEDITLLPSSSTSPVLFFSSVTGEEMGLDQLGVEYWVSNLVGQVRFAPSLAQLCLGRQDKRKKRMKKGTAVEGLVEVGPHSALAGPIQQILRGDPRLTEIFYTSVLVRKEDAIYSALRMAGTLFARGYSVGLREINHGTSDSEVSTDNTILTDLPPYAFNHSRSYTAESRLSRNYRLRSHPRLDLLGVPDAMQCPWEPRWRTYLRLAELPWLRDHRIQGNTVFPAAGYIVMAVEACRQIRLFPMASPFCLENVSISNALVLDETKPTEVLVTLQSDGRFRVYSCVDRWTEHCQGYIHTKTTLSSVGSIGSVDSLSIEDNTFYSRLNDCGLEYGPSFANLSHIRYTSTTCSAQLTVPDTSSTMPHGVETAFLIHPATLDGLLHAVFPPLLDAMTANKEALVPVFIEKICIGSASATDSMTVSSIVREERDVVTADITTASVSISGLRCARLPGQIVVEKEEEFPLAYTVQWKADPDLLTASDLQAMFRDDVHAGLAAYLALLVHQHPDISILSHVDDVNLPEHDDDTLSQYDVVVNGDLRLVKPGGRLVLVDSQVDIPSGMTLIYRDARVVIATPFLPIDSPINPPVVIALDGPCDDVSVNHLCALLESSCSVTTADFQTADLSGTLAIVLSMSASALSQPTAASLDGVKTAMLRSRGLLWVTQGGAGDHPFNPNASLVVGFARTARAEAGRSAIFTLDLAGGSPETAADLIARLFQHRFVYNDSSRSREDEYCEQDGTLMIPRVVSDAVLHESIKERQRSHTVRDQQFQQADVFAARLDGPDLLFAQSLPPSTLQTDQVCIAVKAVGLLPSDHRFVSAENPHTPLGRQCSGIVCAVGESVTAFTPGDRVACVAATGALVSRYTDEVAAFQRIPDEMSFATAAALPVPACEAYALVHRLGEVQAGETVLVRARGDQLTAQLVVQLCRYGGAFIEDANGENKVDVVIDMDDSIDQSVDSCSRHVSRQDVFQLRNDILHTIWKEVMPLFHQGILTAPSPDLHPLSSRLGEVLDHPSGVVTMNPEDIIKVRCEQTSTPLFSPSSSYMLIGGLGGIGRAVALWMASRGARRLVLVSRSGASTASAQETVSMLLDKGVEVTVSCCDVADEEQVKALMLSIPDLAGVIHAAMVLRDTHIQHMSLEDYTAVLAPKHSAVWNLHRYLPTEQPPFLLLLSSISGIIGNATQAAYAAGSSFLDAFAAYRSARGLPTIALDLGVISDAGYLALNRDLAARMARQGFQGMSTRTLLALLESVITNQERTYQVVTGLGRWREGRSLSNFDAPLFAHFRHQFLHDTEETEDPTERQEQDLHQAISTADSLDDAAAIVYTALATRLAASLAVDRESIEPASPVSAYGVDSHAAVELRAWINKRTRTSVALLDILAGASVGDLAMRVAVLVRQGTS